MPLDPSVFEKLGVFYLGRSYDVATRTSSDAPLLYDSRDLVTHAVCVGMTGSGKTGLCLALLEFLPLLWIQSETSGICFSPSPNCVDRIFSRG